MSSPYQRALDLTGLDPRLETYFSQIPLGSVGLGAGVFDVVGTPRLWLWPLLAILREESILAPTWRRDVGFTVSNRPRADGSLVAVRQFDLGDHWFTMFDRMTVVDGRLTDVLGRHGRLRASFDGHVEDGALHLRSDTVEVRVGRRWFALPHAIAPAVTLSERFDAARGRQHVALRLDAPVIGRLYEYSGSFTYAIEPRRADSR